MNRWGGEVDWGNASPTTHSMGCLNMEEHWLQSKVPVPAEGTSQCQASTGAGPNLAQSP